MRKTFTVLGKIGISILIGLMALEGLSALLLKLGGVSPYRRETA